MNIPPPRMVSIYSSLGAVPPSAAGTAYPTRAPVTGIMMRGPVGFRITPGVSVPDQMTALTAHPVPSSQGMCQKILPLVVTSEKGFFQLLVRLIRSVFVLPQ